VTPTSPLWVPRASSRFTRCSSCVSSRRPGLRGLERVSDRALVEHALVDLRTVGCLENFPLPGFHLRHAAREQREHEIARVIVSHLGSPEIIGVEEIQDDSGALDDGMPCAFVSERPAGIRS